MKNEQGSILTVEGVLWVLVVVVALVLRLADLDAAPLNGREAHEALLAWRAVNGEGMPIDIQHLGTGYSPLLFAGNALLFALFGAGDGLARLWPALFGGALALSPLLFRQRIGRVGALGAGLYLALSPTALVASRQVDGTAIAAVGGVLFLAGLMRFFDWGVDGRSSEGRRAWLILSAGGLALAVTSSSSAYGMLLVLGLAGVALAWAWPSPPREEDADSRHPADDRHPGEGEGRQWWWESLRPDLVRPDLGRVVVVFLLAGLAFSTGLGWNPGGLGAAGDLLTAWFARFGAASDAVASPFALLALYEPLAVIFGLGGLVWAIWHGRRRISTRMSSTTAVGAIHIRFSVLLGLWAGLGVLLLVLMPGRAVLDVLWVVLPLAMLTGVAVEQLGRSLLKQGEWFSEGLYVPVVLLLWGHLYLMLAHYATYADPTDVALALLAVVLQGLLAAVFALTIRVDSAFRAVAVGTGVVLWAATLSIGWDVAHVRPTDPRELLVREPTAVEVQDLVHTLRDLSWQDTGVPTRLPFTLAAASDPVLAWYLRDFSAAQYSVDGRHSLDAEKVIEPVLVTAYNDLSDLTLPGVPDDAQYVGQDFVLRRRWDPVEVRCFPLAWPPNCDAAVKWVMFRETASPPAADRWAVLWERGEEAEN